MHNGKNKQDTKGVHGHSTLRPTQLLHNTESSEDSQVAFFPLFPFFSFLFFSFPYLFFSILFFSFAFPFFFFFVQRGAKSFSLLLCRVFFFFFFPWFGVTAFLKRKRCYEIPTANKRRKTHRVFYDRIRSVFLLLRQKSQLPM